MKKIFYSILSLFLALTLVSCIKINKHFDDNGEIYEDKEWDIYEKGHLVTEPITIDYWSANSAVDHQGAAQDRLVEKFNKMQKEKYPDSPITVRIAFQGGYNTQNQKLQAALMGNNNPEIAMVGVSSMSLYLKNAVDMREIFTYDEIRNVFEGFLQFAMYQKKFIGYPYFAATNALLVNKARWEKAGLELPSIDTIVNNPEQSTWTWEAFEEAAKKMTVVENGETKYGLATANIPLYEGLFTQGVAPYNQIATEATFNNEAGLKMLTFWQSLVKKGYMLNPVEDPNHGTKIQADFADGNIGMFFASSSGFQTISSQVEEDFGLAVLPHPKAQNFYANQSGGGLIIFNNKSKTRQKAAVEFLRWLQEDEQTIEFSTASGYLPTTYSSIQTQAWKDHVAKYPAMQEVIDLMSIKLPEDLRVPSGKAKMLADNEFAQYSKGVFYDNATRDPKTILKETFDRVNSILKMNN